MKRADIERLLPEIFQRTLPPDEDGDNLLRAYLSVMELLHAPSEQVLASLNAFFDPYLAPDRFVPYLAGWVDLDQVWLEEPAGYHADNLPAFPAGLGSLRELIAAAAALSRWRGTRAGLRQFLETATGSTGFDIEEDVEDETGTIIPFHIRVRVPPAAHAHASLIRRIIGIEKPAYVTYELVMSE
jgi:phage tail-like protein